MGITQNKQNLRLGLNKPQKTTVFTEGHRTS